MKIKKGETMEKDNSSDLIVISTAGVLAVVLGALSVMTLIRGPEGLATWQVAVPAVIGIISFVLAYIGTQVWNPFVSDVDAETRSSDERYQQIDQQASRQTLKIAMMANAVGGIAFTITPFTVDLKLGTILVGEAVGQPSIRGNPGVRGVTASGVAGPGERVGEGARALEVRVFLGRAVLARV